MPYTATVFHNALKESVGRSPAMVVGYTHGDPLVPVFRTELDHLLKPVAVLDAVFHLLNVGDDPSFGTPDPRAIEYRERRNRSMSVGDVVHVQDGTAVDIWYACRPTGWESIGTPENIVGESFPGTTAIELNE